MFDFREKMLQKSLSLYYFQILYRCKNKKSVRYIWFYCNFRVLVMFCVNVVIFFGYTLHIPIFRFFAVISPCAHPNNADITIMYDFDGNQNATSYSCHPLFLSLKLKAIYVVYTYEKSCLTDISYVHLFYSLLRCSFYW